jgi:dienelactone hydrolase
MAPRLRWTSDGTAYDGVVEHPFVVSRGGSPIPGIFWSPAYAGRSPLPVVLLGHGGSGHKRHERVVRLARWFATEAGVASVSIDATFHGERVQMALSTAEYQARTVSIGVESVVDAMVEDWLAVVAALAAEGLVDSTRLGYLGLSLGTRFGLPLAARLGPDLRAAVLGKFGLTQTDLLPPGLAMTDRLRRDAPAVTAPVLFHVQWDDEIFPRTGQLDLFDLIGSSDKVLYAYPGRHAETRPQVVDDWCRFIADRLATSVRDPAAG